eukprot:535724-Prymnesium_polylepis.1
MVCAVATHRSLSLAQLRGSCVCVLRVYGAADANRAPVPPPPGARVAPSEGSGHSTAATIP